MTSLGFSEYAETNNNSNEPKNNIRGRNGGGGIGGRQNRTLKIPRNQELLKTTNETFANPPNEMAAVAGKKIKQIKDYIENIHRKGGEDSEEDPDDDSSILPSYPAQGMGIYATNVSHSGVIRGAETVSSKTSPPQVVRKTTQMNSLNPSSSYSSTLLEGMDPLPLRMYRHLAQIRKRAHMRRNTMNNSCLMLNLSQISSPVVVVVAAATAQTSQEQMLHSSKS